MKNSDNNHNFEVYLSLHFCSFIVLVFGFLSELHTRNLILSVIIILFIFFFFISIKNLLKYFSLWNFKSILKIFIVLYIFFLPFSLFLAIFFIILFPSIFLRVLAGLFLLIVSIIIFKINYRYYNKREDLKFSEFYRNKLPTILALILLSSFIFSASFFNLQYSLIFFIFYNFNSFKNFFLGYWTEMILKSSYVWNFLRFCSPVPLLLFDDFVLSIIIFDLAKGKLIFINDFRSKNIDLMFSKRYLNINAYRSPEKPWFKLDLDQVDPFIQKFVVSQAEFLICEWSRLLKDGYPTKELKEFMLDLKVKDGILQNFESFLTLNNKDWDSREFLHFLFLLSRVELWETVIPTVSLFSGKEYLAFIKPSTTANFKSLDEIITFFYIKNNVKAPSIISHNNAFFLIFSATEYLKIEDENMVLQLQKYAQKETFTHTLEGLKNPQKFLALLFSANDFFIFNNFTLSVDSISSKSSLHKDTYARFATIYKIINISQDTITIYNSEREEIFQEKFSEFSKKILTLENKTKMAYSLQLSNQALLEEFSNKKRKLTLAAVKHLISDERFIIRSKIPLITSSKKEDF